MITQSCGRVHGLFAGQLLYGNEGDTVGPQVGVLAGRGLLTTTLWFAQSKQR